MRMINPTIATTMTMTTTFGSLKLWLAESPPLSGLSVLRSIILSWDRDCLGQISSRYALFTGDSGERTLCGVV
jgi:hypothetical protein